MATFSRPEKVAARSRSRSSSRRNAPHLEPRVFAKWIGIIGLSIAAGDSRDALPHQVDLSLVNVGRMRLIKVRSVESAALLH